MKPSKNLENKTLSDAFRAQLVCKKVQAHSFRITPGIQSGLLTNQGVMTFLNILGVTEILCSFRLVPEGKTGKEIPESLKLEFLEKFWTNNFALTDA